MQNQDEKNQPEALEAAAKRSRLFADRYFLYMVICTILLILFSFAPYFTNLVGLPAPSGWKAAFFIALYRVIYILCAAIGAWRFGILGGIGTSLILTPAVFLPLALGIREGTMVVDAALVLYGCGVSIVIGRQGNLQRLLFKSTAELHQQATLLKQEVAEREKAEQDIKTLSIGAIQALVFALEAKDKHTAGHSRRVTDFAMAIGSRMNLSVNELDDLRCGSLLHDVGKIAVDPLIHNKTGKLTIHEYEHVMTHIQAGADIVKPIVNGKVVEFILHHHDYYNGGSSMSAPTGENIPLGARIIALADAFDAMTSDRPYRAAMSAADALEEVRSNTGTQFDPVVVKTFLEIPSGEIAAIMQHRGK